MTAAQSPTPDPRRPQLTEPMPYGYLYLGMRVDPPGRLPFVRRSARRRAVLEACKRRASELEAIDEVVAVTVYRAVIIPPLEGSPRFDVMTLVETTSPGTIAAVQATEAYQRLGAGVAMAARNVRRIGDVDRQRTGAFLFNHFTTDDPERALPVLEEIAGWFVSETGVTDTALLQPIGAAPFAFVTHIRLPGGPLGFIVHLAKPSFRNFVLARLRAAEIRIAPVICEAV